MIGYQAIPLYPALAPHVEQLWVQTGATAGEYAVYPSPAPVAGFQWRGAVSVGTAGDARRLAPAGITGILGQARRFQAEPGTRSILARLRPHGAFALLGGPMAELRGKHLGFEDLVETAEARRAMDAIANAATIYDAGAIVQGFLLGLLHRSRSQVHPAVIAATTAILERGGDGGLQAIAARTGWGPRQLQRLFHQQVGVGPKEFGALVRFQNALRGARQRPNWADLAAAAGYADQAHLVRDFKARAGATPSRLPTLASMSLLFNPRRRPVA